MEVIQELKLSSNSKTPNIQNSTTVRKDRRRGQGGDLLTLIHNSINFSWKPESPETLVELHLEELTIRATLGDTELIITNVYIPQQALAQEVTVLLLLSTHPSGNSAISRRETQIELNMD